MRAFVCVCVCGGGGGGGWGVGVDGTVCKRERETQGARRKGFFDWLVAFTKVKLMVANCTLAKCSEEHIYHKKWQSHVYIQNP